MVHIEADGSQRMGKKVDGHEMLDMQRFTFESDGISLQGWFKGPWQVNDEDRYALLVVDSIMGGFRVDYSGRGELADRQQKLAKVMNKLQKAGFPRLGGFGFSPTAECYGVFAQCRFWCVLGELGRVREGTGFREPVPGTEGGSIRWVPTGFWLRFLRFGF